MDVIEKEGLVMIQGVKFGKVRIYLTFICNHVNCNMDVGFSD